MSTLSIFSNVPAHNLLDAVTSMSISSILVTYQNRGKEEKQPEDKFEQLGERRVLIVDDTILFKLIC